MQSVGLVCENYPPDAGGIAASARRLSETLSRHLTVHVFSFPRGNPDTPPSHTVTRASGRLFLHELRPFVNGWTVPASPELRADVIRRAAEALSNVLRGERVSIVHGFGLQNAGVVAARASQELNLPLVQSARGNDVGRNAFHGTRRQILEWSLAGARKVVAVNRWIADLIRWHFPHVGGRVTVVGNGVEVWPAPRVPEPRGAEELSGTGRHGPVVGFVGDLREKKGIHVVEYVVNNFLGRRGGRMLIVGDEDTSHYRMMGWSGGRLDGRFVIRRRARGEEELRSLISLCDWLVFPSLDDGMANGLLEAMACARPVVCSSVFSDVVRDGRDGIVVSPFDPASYVAACEALWADPRLRACMGSSARERVGRDFSTAREGENWLRLYAGVLGG